jgi:mono/diheme cytochrome c family protein
VTRRSMNSVQHAVSFVAVCVTVAGCTAPGSSMSFASGSSTAQPADAQQDQIARGRFLVLSHDCGGCHGGGSNPASTRWLTGVIDTTDEFHVGPFITRPKNLTPDNTTGIGRFSERQIFNSLRYGLRPEETPDVEITSTTPGQGNFPAHPHYLAPPMPWMAWRHMPDEDLWAIAAYLKKGVKPVRNKVEDSEGPPDFWASEMTPAKIGTYPAAPFPTANERQ